ncbi:MAG: hypothetical protein OEV92_05240, partial [Nitrospinota bacterium]|nr:hypothetical protein [Nitrospinota bacterium]
MKVGNTLALALLLWAMAPAAAMACKCAGPPPTAQAVASSTAVFAGYVEDIVTIGPGAERLNEHEHLVIMKVRQRWKGQALAEERVITRKVAPACGYPFEKGKVYIVFATGGPDARRTSRCSNTAPFSAALAEELDS